MREPRLERNDPPGRGRDASAFLDGYGGRGGRRPSAGRERQSAIASREAERLSLGAASAVAKRMERLDLRRASRALESERGRGIVPHLRLAISITDEEGRMPGVEECGAEVRAVDPRDRAGRAVLDRNCAVAGFNLAAQDLTVVIHASITTWFELHGESS